jgi:hypothetical protein
MELLQHWAVELVPKAAGCAIGDGAIGEFGN